MLWAGSISNYPQVTGQSDSQSVQHLRKQKLRKETLQSTSLFSLWFLFVTSVVVQAENNFSENLSLILSLFTHALNWQGIR